MSNSQQNTITESAYLTLHYRLASLSGENFVSTFAGSPATLQLGIGQLAPSLEACLLGLPEGAHQIFELSAEQAFGHRNPNLIQKIARSTLDENSPADQTYAVGDFVEFSAPSGGRFAGVLRELGDEDVVFDFNHPLAGQPVIFEVRIIGIL